MGLFNRFKKVELVLAQIEIEITDILLKWGDAHKGLSNLTRSAYDNNLLMADIYTLADKRVKENGLPDVDIEFKIMRDPKFGTVLPIVKAKIDEEKGD